MKKRAYCVNKRLWTKRSFTFNYIHMNGFDNFRVIRSSNANNLRRIISSDCCSEHTVINVMEVVNLLTLSKKVKRLVSGNRQRFVNTNEL